VKPGELIFEESRPLSGVVLGSEDEPIADARVSIASHDVEETVRTDGMGSFRFTENVPAEDVSLVAETVATRRPSRRTPFSTTT